MIKNLQPLIEPVTGKPYGIYEHELRFLIEAYLRQYPDNIIIAVKLTRLIGGFHLREARDFVVGIRNEIIGDENVDDL